MKLEEIKNIYKEYSGYFSDYDEIDSILSECNLS